VSIAPIDKTVQVKAAPERAFELFATRMGDWWPKGGGVGKAPCVDVILEPQAGGRWYERDADGVETLWGKVLAYEPPNRLLLAWQLTTDWTFDPALETEVELTFSPADGGGTLVRLVHTRLENFGPTAASHSELLRGGWPTRVGLFVRFADEHA
jgi:uncharacterized protein YndB with AHSA1/START domain